MTEVNDRALGDGERTAIIAAAAGSVSANLKGKAWEDAVLDRALDITLLTRSGSRISKLVDRLGGAKMFVTTIAGITKETSSNRGLITMQGKPTKFHKDGIETARSDRLDDFDKKKAEMAKELCKNIRDNLIGHKVIVHIGTETVDGTDYRVLVHVIDLGVDDSFTPASS